MRIWLAIRVFFRTLFDSATAAEIDCLLQGESPRITDQSKPLEAAPPSPPLPEPAKAERSEAITLLATLQREARFVDMIMEPLGEYSDAQIGAAARDVLRDCGQVLERLFAVEPLLSQTEGDTINVEEGYDPEFFRLTGNVAGNPPYTGALVHHGWQTTRCNLPQWSGTESAGKVITAAEVELK